MPYFSERLVCDEDAAIKRLRRYSCIRADDGSVVESESDGVEEGCFANLAVRELCEVLITKYATDDPEVLRRLVVDGRAREDVGAVSAELEAEDSHESRDVAEVRIRVRDASEPTEVFTKEDEKPLRCSLGGSVMRDPVIASDGYTYERQNILAWLESSHARGRSPMTSQPLTGKLFDNIILKQLIDDYRAQRSSLGMSPVVLEARTGDVVVKDYIGSKIRLLYELPVDAITVGARLSGASLYAAASNTTSFFSSVPHTEESGVESRLDEGAVLKSKTEDGVLFYESLVNPRVHAQAGMAFIHVCSPGAAGLHSAFLFEYVKDGFYCLDAADIAAFSGNSVGVDNVRLINVFGAIADAGKVKAVMKQKKFIVDHTRTWVASQFKLELIKESIYADMTRVALAIARAFDRLDDYYHRVDRVENPAKAKLDYFTDEKEGEPVNRWEAKDQKTGRFGFDPPYDPRRPYGGNLNDFLVYCQRLVPALEDKTVSEQKKFDAARLFMKTLSKNMVLKTFALKKLTKDKFLWSGVSKLTITGKQKPDEEGLIPYRFTGSGLYAGAGATIEDGVNCTQWCKQKLRSIGITDFSLKNKPHALAPPKFSCVIM